MFKLINKKCAECASPVEFDKEMQDYVCLNSECQCYQEVGDDMAFDDCRKCGGQCTAHRETVETFEGAGYDGEPQYGEGVEITLVCDVCHNERPGYEMPGFDRTTELLNKITIRS